MASEVIQQVAIAGNLKNIAPLSSRENINILDFPLEKSSISIQRRNKISVETTVVFVSLLFYLVNTLSDVLVTAELLKANQFYFGLSSLLFIIGSAFVTQIFSFRWQLSDNNVTCFQIVIHCFFLQPLERFLTLIVQGFEPRKLGTEEHYFYLHNDVSMLRLFQVFIQNAPMICLQFYIILFTPLASCLSGISAAVGLLSIGWSVSAYGHAMRMAHRPSYHISLCGLLLQVAYQSFMIVSRVAAIVAFTSVYGCWVFLALGLHWLVMAIWVVLQRTEFCSSWLEEKLFNIVVSIIYIFCFFSLKEGQTRIRMSFFYIIFFIENLMFILAWYPHRFSRYSFSDLLLISLTVVSFSFGLLLLSIYYRFFHPSGGIDCLQNHYLPAESEKQISTESLHLQSNFRSVRKAVSTGFLPARSLVRMLSAPSQIHSSGLKKSRSAGCAADLTGDTTTESTEFDKTGDFRHYSVDASVCMQVSQCGTLQDFTGIDLSNMNTLDSVREDSPVRDSSNESYLHLHSSTPLPKMLARHDAQQQL